MPNVVVRLDGGLGNQLFQFAFGFKLASLNAAKLFFDTSFSENRQNPNFPRPSVLKKILPTYSEYDASKISFSRWVFIKNKERFFEIEESPIHDFSFEYLKSSNANFYVKGYWQSAKYFSDIKGKLKYSLNLEQISLSDEAHKYKNEIKFSQNSCAVHIRRGDFLIKGNDTKYFVLTSTDYYKRSLETILKLTVVDKFFLFTDDVDWCLENINNLFSAQNLEVVSNTKAALEDFYLMSKCKHQIIANSTFSWWAAWLNTYAEKKVIAPKKWFLNDWDESNIVPAEWIKV